MFYRMLSFLFKILVYRGYHKKYGLPSNFRFNGYMIRIHGDGEIVCGGNSYISFFSYINVVKGSRLFIGEKVSIAHNVKIYTSTFDTHKLIHSGEKHNVIGDVTIGNNVLVGSNSYICPGVRIGNNVVIGANSVVTKDLDSNGVYAGTPAKRIK